MKKVKIYGSMKEYKKTQKRNMIKEIIYGNMFLFGLMGYLYLMFSYLAG